MTPTPHDQQRASGAARAFSVHTRDYEHGTLIFAATAGKARAEGSRDLDEEFTSVHVKREPRFDALKGLPITGRTFIEHGWWQSCVKCHGMVHADDEGGVFYDAADHALCSQCHAADPHRARRACPAHERPANEHDGSE